MSRYLISATELNKYFVDGHKRLHVLKDVDFQVKKGEFVMLLGPSGSGKSTLLRVLAGLEPYDSGQVTMAPHSRLAFVFQSFALFPWLNVYENVEFGLKMRGDPEIKRRSIVHALIEEVGLTQFVKSYPRELSGGMRQRVGIARALAIDPDIIFLDEPFSALDSFTATQLRQELLRLWEGRGLTLVMVTHLIEEALLLGDRIVMLTPVPARIEASVTNPLPRPRDPRSPQFFKQMDQLTEIIKT